MNKFKIISVVAVMFLLAIPMGSYAETGQECASKCVETCSDGGNNKDDDAYKNCLSNCLEGCMDNDTGIPDVPAPTPADQSQSTPDLNSSMFFAEAGTEVDSILDDFDQPCYVGGSYLGNCSRNKPYYNAFSGECYSTLQDCKEADGDLASVQGNGSCVRCGK